MTSSPRFTATTDLGTSLPQPVPLAPSYGPSAPPTYPQAPGTRCSGIYAQILPTRLPCRPPPSNLPCLAQQFSLMSLPTYRRRSPRGSLPRTLLQAEA